MHDIWRYLRANPQAMALLMICVVLGLGTFIVVLLSIATSGGQNTGDPDGSSLGILHAAVTAIRVM
jgi:hypothetical protein